MFKNTRYIIGLLGSTDISQETLGIGDSTVTGAIKGLNESLDEHSYALNGMRFYNANTDISDVKNRKQAVIDMIADTQSAIKQINGDYTRFIRTIRYEGGYSTQCIVGGYTDAYAVIETPMNQTFNIFVHIITPPLHTVYKIPMELVE